MKKLCPVVFMVLLFIACIFYNGSEEIQEILDEPEPNNRYYDHADFYFKDKSEGI